MRRLFTDPLVHFLAIGAALFGLLSIGGDSDEPNTIVIPAQQVEQVVKAATLMRAAPLSDVEIRELIEPVIRDEVYYREALALGLDRDDDTVRTRLIEKMRYLTENLAEPAPASEDELRAFFAAEPTRFRLPETVTFDQKFFSPSQRGEAIEADLQTALAALRGGAAATDIGDSTPLRERYVDAPREQVAVLFGPQLADSVFSMEPGEWQGPFRSDFGFHLVRVLSRSAASQPTYEDARDRVLEAYAEERRRRRNENAFQSMRERYDVIVEWPRSE